MKWSVLSKIVDSNTKT